MFKNKKFMWVGPGLVVIAGIINLLNPGISNVIKVAWYVLLPLALVAVIYGIISHIRSE